ncbi:MAG: radical SAM protein [Spirochaetes bacterium]|nr:radical SAM protein [Spirochaetota bacterium]
MSIDMPYAAETKANFYSNLRREASLRPLAMLIMPPIYDFAFFDLFLKPYGLLKIGKWLEEGGWECVFINSLDYTDEFSRKTARRKPPVRYNNGTGKIFRQILPPPFSGSIPSVKRGFARYGICEESLRLKIMARKPDIILISTFMTYWYMGVSEVVKICREIWPSVPVITGGVYATLFPEHCKNVVMPDYVAEGEAWNFLNSFFKKHSLPVCSQEGGKFLMDNPVWEDAAVVRLNNGCPMKCSYCASAKLSSFSVGCHETVFKQLVYLNKKYGTSNFAFYDDSLLFNKEKTFLPLLEEIISSNIKFNFYTPNGLHIDFLDTATVSMMKKAGFKEIRLGFESSNPEFHKKNGKKYNADTFPAVIETLKTNGFYGDNVIIYMLAGLPGQYAEEAKESVRYLKKFDVRISVSEYSPVPGSIMWEESVKKSIYPISEDPLYHNNSVFPMSWEKFSYKDMQDIKNFARYR